MSKSIATQPQNPDKADVAVSERKSETPKVRLGDSMSPWSKSPKVRLGDSMMPW